MSQHNDELVISLVGQRRIDATIRGHVIHTDQPRDNGGEDVASSPFELFLASIGTCAGIFVQGFCAKRGLPTEGIRVIERPHYDAQGGLADIELELQLPPTFPQKYQDALVKVVEQCSVKKAIAAQPPIVVRPVMT